MARELDPLEQTPRISIKPFDWPDWEHMWRLRAVQLAEDGIIVDEEVSPPDFGLAYDETNPGFPEMDMERIDQCYLKGRGNFWIAWMDGQPAGYVGAQDLGDFVELRRMYVRAANRRLGIGALLVQALIDHCRRQHVRTIKLWTAAGGPGRRLYARLGFRQAPLEGSEVNHRYALNGEIRMRLDLAGAGEQP